MTALLADWALVLGGPFIVSLLVKVTLVFGLALVVTHLARRTRAAVRHVLLAAAFAVALLLPVASWLIPSVSLEVPVAPAALPIDAARAPALTISVYRIAIGFPGEPVAPLSFSGAKKNANS
jgi:hypothetical protein